MQSQSSQDARYPGHCVYVFDDDVTFSSNFDNGNLARVERCSTKSYDFRVWTAPDNMDTIHQSKPGFWFYFVVTGLPAGATLRINIVNASNHGGLYKYDMRPVYRGQVTNHKWVRLRNSVRYSKDGPDMQLSFEHIVDIADDKLSFAFTYPYSYSMVCQDCATIEAHENNFSEVGSIYAHRELLTTSCEGRRIELLTISSVDGANQDTLEPTLTGLFPEQRSTPRCVTFPDKEVIFVSARVHPGEVPAQHTFKGILNLLMDKTDKIAIELRRHYVFKLVPMLNPDGVYRGHCRMDQHGQNLNRYYLNPDPSLQPAIYAAKTLLDYYATSGKLSLYLDFHAHASKRGCFIYGNVMGSLEDQIQNQMFCRLIALNTPHFDYDGCLFSREHMTRIDPGDMAKGLTAEGSGRVDTFLSYGIIHSYTLECNYNTGRIGNEVPATDEDVPVIGPNTTPAALYTGNPDKYTPSSYASVGRACIAAMLDIRGHNPCSRLPKSKYKTLDRLRQFVAAEVRGRKEYRNQSSGISIQGVQQICRERKDRRQGDDSSGNWRRVTVDFDGSSSNSDEVSGCNASGPDTGGPASFVCVSSLPPTKAPNSVSTPISSSSAKARLGQQTTNMPLIPMALRKQSVTSTSGRSDRGASPSLANSRRLVTRSTTPQEDSNADVASGVVGESAHSTASHLYKFDDPTAGTSTAFVAPKNNRSTSLKIKSGQGDYPSDNIVTVAQMLASNDTTKINSIPEHVRRSLGGKRSITERKISKTLQAAGAALSLAESMATSRTKRQGNETWEIVLTDQQQQDLQHPAGQSELTPRGATVITLGGGDDGNEMISSYASANGEASSPTSHHRSLRPYQLSLPATEHSEVAPTSPRRNTAGSIDESRLIQSPAGKFSPLRSRVSPVKPISSGIATSPKSPMASSLVRQQEQSIGGGQLS